jgi:uncharacterized protein
MKQISNQQQDNGKIKGSSLGVSGLRLAMIAGCNAAIIERDELNRINVFPVADGDTGTNLAFTFSAMREQLRQNTTSSIATLTAQAAMAAIEGSRGNSGAIIAQFFYGFGQALQSIGSSRITVQPLIEAITQAAASARRAIAAPRDGTMLSVFDAIAKALKQHKPSSVVEFVQSCLSAAQIALDRTPQQLKVLADHQVVDAGAKGVWHFFQGVAAFLKNRRQALSNLDKDLLISEQTLLSHAHHEQSAYRYCCECALQGADLAAVRSALGAEQYDSLVLAGGEKYARLHVHSNQPAHLFAALEKVAKVQSRKADDMHAQQRAKLNTAKVAIVSDSAADLPENLIESLNICTVHVRVNFGADEFIDRITLTPKQLYERMASSIEPARTSQPPTGEFLRLFDQLTSQDKDVVCLNVSSALSGTWQAAKAAAVHGGKQRTRVLDTLNAAVGQALLVIDAARAAQAGYSAAQIEERVIKMRTQTHTMAVVRDLSFGVRGGRIPRWVGQLAGFLHAKALIASNARGLIKLAGVLWGDRSIPERFAKWALRHALSRHPAVAGPVRVIVGHCDNPAGAEAAASYLTKTIAQLEQIDVVDAGLSIGAHAGPGALAIAIQFAEPL